MDKKNEKKFIQSPVAIVCYLIAALMLVYASYQGGSTVKQINEYYAGYGMSAQASEYVKYVFQAVMEPIFHAIIIFMAGYILNAVRKLDPKNFKSADELAEMKEAKKLAKEKKQAAKGEAKAVMAGHEVSKDESVRADFAESLDAELKAEDKPAKSTSRKNGQSRSESTQNKSDGQSKSGDSRKSSSSNKSKSQAPKKPKAKAEDKTDNKSENKSDTKTEKKTEDKADFKEEVKNDIFEKTEVVKDSENKVTVKED